MNKNNDFIDLSSLSVKIKSKINAFLYRLLTFTINYWKWYLLVFILINSMATVFIISSKDVFKTEAKLELKVQSANDVKLLLDKLNSINKEQLKVNLDLTEDEAKSILKVEAIRLYDQNRDNIADFIDYKNEIKQNDTNYKLVLNQLQVVVLYNNQNSLIIEKLNKGILNYLNSNENVIKYNEIRKNILKSMMQETQKEIAILEMYQKKEYFEYRQKNMNSNQIILTNDNTSKLYYKDLLSLKEKVVNYSNELNYFQEPFILIDSFFKPNQPMNSGLKIFLIANFIFALLFIGGYWLYLFVRLFKNIYKLKEQM